MWFDNKGQKLVKKQTTKRKPARKFNPLMSGGNKKSHILKQNSMVNSFMTEAVII